MKQRIQYFVLGGLVIGLLLSIVSWLRICTSSCAAVHQYKFYGFSFEALGILFFVTGIFFQWFALRPWIGIMIASAVGGELYMLYVQKAIIGQWCPICVTIATTVCITYGLYFFGEGRKEMKQKLITIPAIFVGFLVAFVGVAKPEKTFASALSGRSHAFGTQSKVDVYIATDWFCPACHKIEPIIAHSLPKLKRRAHVYFIDVPLHEESYNYVPYNLSFMVNNKSKYLELRQALIGLTRQTKSPTPAQVAEVVAPLGVRYQPLGFREVNLGMEYNEEIAQKFRVNTTPTVIIYNKDTGEDIQIKGKAISRQSILDAIRRLEE